MKGDGQPVGVEVRWKDGTLGVDCPACGAFMPLTEEAGIGTCPGCGASYKLEMLLWYGGEESEQ